MILTDKMIKEAKRCAWENEDTFIHKVADGWILGTLPMIEYKGKEYYNPWSEEVLSTIGDPFEVFGMKKMEEFCIQVLAKKCIEGLFGECCPKGHIYIGEEGLGKERYALGELGKKNMICFGINPSTAMPGDDDPTIKRVRKLATRLGCDGWIMLNMYPIRQTDPNQLTKKPDEFAIKKNEMIVKGILERYYDSPIWAAWGTNIDKYDYLKELLVNNVDMFKDREWYCRGKCSKAGHPHHPLYVADKEEFTKFDVIGYCERLKI